MNKLTRFVRHQKRTRHAVYMTDRNILRSVQKSMILLAVFAILHVLAMVRFEGMSLWDAFWLTMTTLTTVGYGDLTAETVPGRIATMLLIFLIGITLMTLLISDYVDFRIARRERIRSGHWDWNMDNHILIINTPKYNRENYFTRMVSQLRESDEFKETPIMLLNEDFQDGLPDSLKSLGVVHVTGLASRPEDLVRANAERVQHIVVLARNEYSSDSDSYTFDVCHRLWELSLGHKTIVECVDDTNRQRLKELDVRAVIRPIRSYPELVVRSMVAPGSEVVIEDMFTHANDHTVRYPVWLEGERWADVVNAIIQSNIGTPLAYVTRDGEVIMHPDGDDHVHAQSLLILVHTERASSAKDVHKAIENHFNVLLKDIER
jgi:voltage-gated potassium channel